MEKLNFTTDKFIKGFRHLRKLPLTLSQVNTIEYILSYQLAGTDWNITNMGISNYIMMKPKSVNNLLNKLADSGYINIDWNNIKNPDEKVKRYLTVNIGFVNKILDLQEQTPKINTEKDFLATSEPEAWTMDVSKEIMDNSQEEIIKETSEASHLGDNRLIEENDYPNMVFGNGDESDIDSKKIAFESMSEYSKKVNALDFDELRIIELITKHPEFSAKLCKDLPNISDNIAKNEFTNIQLQYLKNFHEAMLLNEKFKNEYRTIQLVKKKEVLV